MIALAIVRPDINQCRFKVIMIEDIKNYAAVTPMLSTAGQPSEKQIEELKEAGFRAVINLGLANQPYSLENEKEKVESLGMRYFHIPIPFESPEAGHFDRFMEAMDQLEGEKTFLHCAANYRASSFAYLHGRIRGGWSGEKAEEYLKGIWEPNPTWRAFLETCSRLRDGAHGPRSGPVPRS